MEMTKGSVCWNGTRITFVKSSSIPEGVMDVIQDNRVWVTLESTTHGKVADFSHLTVREHIDQAAFPSTRLPKNDDIPGRNPLYLPEEGLPQTSHPFLAVTSWVKGV